MLHKLDPKIESKTIILFNKAKYLQRVHRITCNANNKLKNHTDRQFECQAVVAAH